MKKNKNLRALALVVASVGVCSIAQADVDSFVREQAIVRLSPGASLDSFHQRYGTSTLDTIPFRSLVLIQLPAGIDEDDFVADLDGDADVAYATLNFLGEDTVADGTTQSIFLRTFREQYIGQSAIPHIGADQAIQSTTGRGSIVAVLDSGLDTSHPDIANRVAPGVFDFILNATSISDVATGSDSNGNDFPDEFVGHGTHIAGAILRAAPSARVLPIRVMDSDGRVNLFDAINGIYHAVKHNADVINMSFGMIADAEILRDAVTHAVDAGVIVVASTGNDSSTSVIRYPAGYSNLGVIAVASSAMNDVRSEFTTIGPHVNLLAVGEGIVGTLPNGQHGVASGTSFSTALVSGAAALLKAGCVDATGVSTRAALLNGARDVSVPNNGFPGQVGAGALNIMGSLELSSCILICSGDLDNDGDATSAEPDGAVDVSDLLYFLAQFDLGAAAADLDNGSGIGIPDGAVEINDLLYFLLRFEHGC